jgi:putative sigma-54 modulation protein
VEITVSARHIDISPALRAAAEAKFGRLSRFLGGMDRAEVHFVEEQNPRISAREVCEVTLEGPGRRVRAKAAATDTFAAIDLAVDKLEHQLVSLKTKIVRSDHGGRRVPISTAFLGLDGSSEGDLVIEA